MDGITDSMHMNLGKFQEMVRDREAWHAAVYELQRVRYDLATEQQQGEWDVGVGWEEGSRGRGYMYTYG